LDVIGAVTTTNITSRGTNDLVFNVSSVERMRIHNGRVGINTNNPQCSLHIVGDFVQFDSSVGNRGFFLDDQVLQFHNGTNNGYLQFNDGLNPGGMRLQAGDFGNLVMDNIGRVAINAGASSFEPSTRAALQVERDGDTEIGIFSSDFASHYWTLQSSGVSGSSANLDASFQIIDRSAGAGVSRLIIRTNGNVGIGTTGGAGPDALLTVNGTADKPGGGSWGTFSDARLKDVGADFTNGLESLEAIQPVHYHYKTDNPLDLPAQTEYVGVVAQQVQRVVPEAVEQSSSGYLVLNNDPVFWTVVNAVKTLNHKLETENAVLNRQNEALEKRLEALEQKFAEKENN
jgi:hypothetical protein